ncbi:MAG: glycoside hydrolase family 28 protein [Planctomycetales bacterium]|nr:glycoside hydrolase family 28 protein [Planctomycetales bacterium]
MISLRYTLLIATFGWHTTVFAQAVSLPDPAQVGPRAMPESIAPVQAPFEMAELARPDFGETQGDGRRERVRFAADASGSALVTSTLQAAIDRLSAAGGGTLVVPEGEWLTGRILLKSGVNLHVPRGATLRFSGRIEDYLPVVFARYEGLEVMSLGGLIYAHNADRIAITGRGTLVGPDEGPVREARSGLSDKVVDANLPVEQRVMDGLHGRHYLRPQFLLLMNCRNVLIEGVTLRNGPMWNIVPTYCDRVIVRGVTVHSNGVVNGDGVNIESSRNVLVEYCDMNTGDDCYAMKSGRGADGLRAARPVENVVLRRNHASGGFGGVTFGSETAGGIRNVYVHDCVFENVRHAAYFKTRRPRGGGGERITVERVRFTANNHGLFFDMIGSPLYVGELGERLPRRALTRLTPFYRQITLRDIQGECSEGDALKIKGIPESPASNLLLERIDIIAPGLPNLADVTDVTVRDCRFHAEQPTLTLLDAAGVRFDNCLFDVAGAGVGVDLAGEQSHGVVFRAVEPAVDRASINAHDGAQKSAVSITE